MARYTCYTGYGKASAVAEELKRDGWTVIDWDNVRGRVRVESDEDPAIVEEQLAVYGPAGDEEVA